MIHKIGTIGEFRDWTHQVIREPTATEAIPRHWFDSEETRLRAQRLVEGHERRVLGLDDFSATDIAALEAVCAPEASKAFDDEERPVSGNPEA